MLFFQSLLLPAPCNDSVIPIVWRGGLLDQHASVDIPRAGAPSSGPGHTLVSAQRGRWRGFTRDNVGESHLHRKAKSLDLVARPLIDTVEKVCDYVIFSPAGSLKQLIYLGVRVALYPRVRNK